MTEPHVTGPDGSAGVGLAGVGLAGVRLAGYDDDADRWPVLVWAPGPGWRMLSSAVRGGGLGERQWWLNAQVGHGYRRTDPAAHVDEIAAGLGLSGAGVGLLTAAAVPDRTSATDGGVRVVATVGLGLPVFAAAPDEVPTGSPPVHRPGTINLLLVVPVPMADAALVNLVITATEAKAQALAAAGVPGTGTSSDALCVACPAGPQPDPFGGPRSAWGSRAARAVHRAVAEGTERWFARALDDLPGGEHERR